MKREELLVNAKPILFNTEMVKAILEDRKTVTRRVIKLDLGLADSDKNDSSCLFVQDKYGDSINVRDLCRYQVGDILYVRETWGDYSYDEEHQINYVYYRADYKDCIKTYIHPQKDDCGEEIVCDLPKWKPSIHMPKSAARLFLKVTDVRVERLQDITSKEAIKEGLKDKYAYGKYNSMEPKKLFIDLWNSTINKHDLDSYGWEANPYVWVIEFEKINIEVAHNN